MILLSADDFGLTDGVSRAIAELARHRRISATSALVTQEDWPDHARHLAALRGDLAIGVHLNLTLGQPLGSMPRTAPSGQLPSVQQLIKRALMRQLDEPEITAELTRQLQQFDGTVGHPPDHIDGHQHIHAFPIIRRAMIAAISAMNWPSRPLVRTPTDSLLSTMSRARSMAKAGTVGALAIGLRTALARSGLPTNDTFAGFSEFDRSVDYRAELTSNLSRAGRCHIVMCHPSHVDENLRARDPIVERREQEYETLMAATGLPSRIWHPDRDPDGPPIDWSTTA